MEIGFSSLLLPLNLFYLSVEKNRRIWKDFEKEVLILSKGWPLELKGWKHEKRQRNVEELFSGFGKAKG